MKYNRGDECYIVENNRFVRRATVTQCSGGFCIIKFDEGGGTRLRETKLFSTEEDARMSITKTEVKTDSGKRTPRYNPYNYE